MRIDRRPVLWLAAWMSAVGCSSSTAATGGVDASIADDADVSGEEGGTTPFDGSPADDGSIAADGGTDGAAPPPQVVTSPSLAAFVAAIPHGTDYDSLSDTQMVNMITVARAAADGEVDATSLAASVGYELVSLMTPLSTYSVLRPTAAAPRGQATLILRPAAWKRDLMVEAPHIPYDFETDAEARVIFERVGARALLIAGAQRCCSTVASGCWPNPQCIAAGTSVESDVPHSTHSAFHAIHVGLATGARTTNAVQLHTNEELAINGDVLVSNGLLVTSARVQAFAGEMEKHDAGTIYTCANLDAGNKTYCGVTNAQGIASNGGADACNTYPSSENDRFLHLEQNASDLDDAGAWGLVVAEAIGVAFSN